MTNTPGKGDHRATRQAGPLSALLFFMGYARKAFVAFLAAGGGAALADGIRTLDFTNLTWGNLWTGVGVGFVSAAIVYFTSNRPQEAHAVEPGPEPDVQSNLG